MIAQRYNFWQVTVHYADSAIRGAVVKTNHIKTLIKKGTPLIETFCVRQALRQHLKSLKGYYSLVTINTHP
jgi:hypothetical protein